MAAVFNLNHHASYVHWHLFWISMSNLLVIVAMLVVFCAAILAPFPKPKRPTVTLSTVDDRSWTGRLRGRAVRALPPEKLLPDKQPAYVASWI